MTHAKDPSYDYVLAKRLCWDHIGCSIIYSDGTAKITGVLKSVFYSADSHAVRVHITSADSQEIPLVIDLAPHRLVGIEQ